jgi:hypothetical protein
MNATIALLQGIDYQSVGLGCYGKPGNYFHRQIARWSKQYLDDSEAGRDPSMDRLIDWLPVNIPSGDETSIVHGDFRVDYLIFHPIEPRMVAVLDWKLSTLGHPIADFAYLHMPAHIVAGLAGADRTALNIPTEAQMSPHIAGERVATLSPATRVFTSPLIFFGWPGCPDVSNITAAQNLTTKPKFVFKRVTPRFFQFNPRITIFPVVCSVGQKNEVIPAATATFCEPPAI